MDGHRTPMSVDSQDLLVARQALGDPRFQTPPQGQADALALTAGLPMTSYPGLMMVPGNVLQPFPAPPQNQQYAVVASRQTMEDQNSNVVATRQTVEILPGPSFGQNAGQMASFRAQPQAVPSHPNPFVGLGSPPGLEIYRQELEVLQNTARQLRQESYDALEYQQAQFRQAEHQLDVQHRQRTQAELVAQRADIERVYSEVVALSNQAAANEVVEQRTRLVEEAEELLFRQRETIFTEARTALSEQEDLANTSQRQLYLDAQYVVTNSNAEVETLRDQLRRQQFLLEATETSNERFEQAMFEEFRMMKSYGEEMHQRYATQEAQNQRAYQMYEQQQEDLRKALLEITESEISQVEHKNVPDKSDELYAQLVAAEDLASKEVRTLRRQLKNAEESRQSEQRSRAKSPSRDRRARGETNAGTTTYGDEHGNTLNVPHPINPRLIPPWKRKVEPEDDEMPPLYEDPPSPPREVYEEEESDYYDEGEEEEDYDGYDHDSLDPVDQQGQVKEEEEEESYCPPWSEKLRNAQMRSKRREREHGWIDREAVERLRQERSYKPSLVTQRFRVDTPPRTRDNASSASSGSFWPQTGTRKGYPETAKPSSPPGQPGSSKMGASNARRQPERGNVPFQPEDTHPPARPNTGNYPD